MKAAPGAAGAVQDEHGVGDVAVGVLARLAERV
jgi:hypothetical protein